MFKPGKVGDGGGGGQSTGTRPARGKGSRWPSWSGIETSSMVGGSPLGHTATTDTCLGFQLSHLLKRGLWAELTTLAQDSSYLSDFSRITEITVRTW